MDDLKTYAKNDDEQTGLLRTIKSFSDDIGMEFGLDKCAKTTFKRGRLADSSNIELDVNTVIQDLEQEGTYKYLGVSEGDGIQHSQMKEKIRKEYYRRIRMVLKSELNSPNKLEAINTLAVPVVTYSFNIINWTLQQLAKLDTKTRKFLTMYKMHHPKSDVDRLYLPRIEGGRGLIKLELSYKTTTIGLDKYLQETQDTLLHFVKDHDNKRSLYSISRQSTKFSRELEMPAIPSAENETCTTYARKTKAKAKHQGRQQLRSKWESKALHGKYPQRVKQADVDQDKTHRWLKAAGLKAETEGFIIVAQDQSLSIRWYQHNILKKPDVDPKCRLCGRFDETIDHLVSGCPELAKSEYIHRHNKAVAHIHWKICKEFGIEVKDRWYEHEPTTLTEKNNITILWNMPIHTDRTIAANRPDIVLKNKKDKTCLLIDMTVPLDDNTSVKTTEKLNKYKDLEIEVERMWGLKTTTIPVVIGALGTIKKVIENYINKLPGNINIHELQKITLLSTAHLLRRVLSIK